VAERYRLSRGPGPVFGYLGDSRPSKGFPMLPELVRRVLAEGPATPARFVIQCPPEAASGSNRLPPAVADLRRQVEGSGGRLTLIPERLDERDYAELLHATDVVLIPYRREGYVEPTSGVFAEAMAAGKPVVVPEGTWMERELARTGGGVAFRSGDVDDLVAKTLQAARDFHELSLRAGSGRAAWNEFHNAANLAEILLRAGGLSPVTEAAAPASRG
jgi:glycosyltransferase involved in cell wall biosynthesis